WIQTLALHRMASKVRVGRRPDGSGHPGNPRHQCRVYPSGRCRRWCMDAFKQWAIPIVLVLAWLFTAGYTLASLSRASAAWRARKLPIAIDIERGGQRLFHFAAAGTVPDNATWIERKKNLVRRMFRSSYGVGLKLAASNKTLEDNMGPAAAEYAAHGGCFPIV